MQVHQEQLVRQDSKVLQDLQDQLVLLVMQDQLDQLGNQEVLELLETRELPEIEDHPVQLDNLELLVNRGLGVQVEHLEI